MKGYKVTYNMKCESLTYEVGKTYKISSMKMCKYGFHFCQKAIDVLKYYPPKKDFVLLEIEAKGNVETKDDKSVTDEITILRIIPKKEYKDLLGIELDDKGNLIYEKDSLGREYHWKYDDKGNIVYYKNSNCDEHYWKYDDKGNKIYQKDSYGKECHYKYDDKGNLIYRKESNGNEHHYKYDDKGNKIYQKDLDGKEYHWKYEYDDKGNLIYYKDSNGYEYHWKI